MATDGGCHARHHTRWTGDMGMRKMLCWPWRTIQAAEEMDPQQTTSVGESRASAHTFYTSELALYLTAAIMAT